MKKVFSLLLISICFCAIAQENVPIDRDISSKKMKSRAEHAFSTGDIYTALFYYQEAAKLQPKDWEARYKMAEMYRHTRNYAQAEKAYAAVLDSSGGKYPFSLYYKGLMQKMSGNYEEAKKNLIQFRKENHTPKDKEFKAQLNKDISGCDSGIIYKEFPDNVLIENAGKAINHPHAEFSPFLLDSNTLLYGSLRMELLTYFDVSIENREKQPVRQIYKAERKDDQWVEKGKFELLNDAAMDMGNLVYSAFSDRYFFTKCTKDKKGTVNCQLYCLERAKGKWGEPYALPYPVNMPGYNSTQPAIVQDTSKSFEYLYFVSDRPGGKGGLDIYYTSFNSRKKEWAEPKNFTLINTTGTECTPYFHIPTQTFYFSSDGQISAGGLDVFKTWKDEAGRYTRPINMAFPINSPQDDLGFTLNEQGNKGFVVSNRPGGTPYFHETCCDDIFAFEILPPKPFNCTLDLSVDLDTADCAGKLVKIHSIDIRSKEERTDTIRLSDCKLALALEKNHQYTFKIDLPGYMPDSLVLATRDMASTELISKQLSMRPIKKEEMYEKLSETPEEDKPFVLTDIQYATNETKLSDDAKIALDSILIPFLQQHPKHKVSISAHTDDVGSDKYNMNLSQQRADNVKKYLTAKGIDPNRIIAKGYGESRPLAPNLKEDGSPNPEGRNVNRRTEFQLLK